LWAVKEWMRVPLQSDSHAIPHKLERSASLLSTAARDAEADRAVPIPTGLLDSACAIPVTGPVAHELVRDPRQATSRFQGDHGKCVHFSVFNATNARLARFSHAYRRAERCPHENPESVTKCSEFCIFEGFRCSAVVNQQQLFSRGVNPTHGGESQQ